MSGDQWGFFDEINKKNVVKDSNSYAKLNDDEAGCISRLSLPQMVPQPNGVPWSVNGMSWASSSSQNMPVRFKANPMYKNSILYSNLHTKRKAEPELFIPRKQHISEEKMAASFDGMHISCSYTAHNINSDMKAGEGELDVSTQGPTIVLSPELLKVKPEPILPPSLVERYNSPCTSLVLWRPPKKIITQVESKDTNNNPEEGAEGKARRRGVLKTNMEELCAASAYSTNVDGDMDVEM